MRSLLGTVLVALLTLFGVLAGPASAEDDSQRTAGDPAARIANTGVKSGPAPRALPSAAAQASWDAKAALIEDEALSLRTGKSSQMAAASCPISDPCPSTPASYFIPAASAMNVYAQQKSYTCGPASLRNMVRVMNKVHTGAYGAKSEARMAEILNTTREGTAIGSIVNALNDHWSHYGAWQLSNPADKYAYLASIKVDTYSYKQPLIQGVRTNYLSYYNGKGLNHFNVVSGYKKVTQGSKIRMMDSFDPEKLYGYLPWYGNPYGHQTDWLSKSFKANDLSMYGGKRLIV